MRRIGQGYYYDVFDLGNDRVLKKATGHFGRFKKLIAWYGKTPFKKISIFLAYPKRAHDAKRVLADSMQISALNPAMFGNPIFTKRFDYEQDKAIPLGAYFAEHPFAENREKFEEYLDLLRFLWTHGLSDTIFNFTINTGVSLKTHRLIWTDFNELTNTKEAVKECLRREKWITQASLRDMPNGELKKYILLKIKKELTVENLDRLWRSIKKSS